MYYIDAAAAEKHSIIECCLPGNRRAYRRKGVLPERASALCHAESVAKGDEWFRGAHLKQGKITRPKLIREQAKEEERGKPTSHSWVR
jgi:hypothetical protein